MIHVIYITIILSLVFMLGLYIHEYNKREMESRVLLAVLKDAAIDADAKEQGFTELTDAYETDSLQYEETIEKLNEEKRKLQHQYTDLSQKYADARRAESVSQMQVASLRRQLDIAQVVISEHDLNCLPHIVLSSMEHHKDEALPGI